MAYLPYDTQGKVRHAEGILHIPVEENFGSMGLLANWHKY